MGRPIIGVNHKSKYSGDFGGKTYNYFTDIELAVGDIVNAPTANGDSIAMVNEINVPESEFDKKILPLLKTITEFAESEDE